MGILRLETEKRTFNYKAAIIFNSVIFLNFPF